MSYKEELLAEHRNFRNQLIAASVLLLVVCYWIPQILAYFIIVASLAVYNVVSYKNNLKKYNDDKTG